MKKLNTLIASSILTFTVISHAGLAEQMIEQATQYYESNTRSECKDDIQGVLYKFRQKFNTSSKLSDVTNYARGFNGLAKTTNTAILEKMSEEFLSANNFNSSRVETMIQASGRFCLAMDRLLDAEEEIKNNWLSAKKIIEV